MLYNERDEHLVDQPEILFSKFGDFTPFFVVENKLNWSFWMAWSLKFSLTLYLLLLQLNLT